jgi:hypothetical protein
MACSGTALALEKKKTGEKRKQKEQITNEEFTVCC